MADDPLEQIAAGIERAGMRVPAAMLLEILSPLDVVTSQLARFGRPLVSGTGAAPLLAALEEARAWAELRRRLDRQD